MRQRVSDLNRGAAARPIARQSLTSVLFVCIGNAIRSQMAEAFARKYGADVMAPASAGVSPALAVQPLTKKVLAERGIDIGAAFPKSIPEAPGSPWDIVVNISGELLPRGTAAASTRQWEVADPVGQPEESYVAAAERIETLVMQLILELRSSRRGASVRPGGR